MHNLSYSNGSIRYTDRVELEEGSLQYQYLKQILYTPRQHRRPLLLFLHTSVTDSRMWHRQIEYFADRGWDCLSYDRLGYGNSLVKPEFFPVLYKEKKTINHASHVRAVILHLELQNRPIVLIGIGIGAETALDAALNGTGKNNHLLVKGLILCNGTVSGYSGQEPNEREINRSREYADYIQDVKTIENSFKSPGQRLDEATLCKAWNPCYGVTQETRLTQVDFNALMESAKKIVKAERLMTGGDAINLGERQDDAAALISDGRPEWLLLKENCCIRAAYGRFDCAGTQLAMQFLYRAANSKSETESVLGQQVVFDTAHLCNVEQPRIFDAWLEDCLNAVLWMLAPVSPVSTKQTRTY